MRARSSPASGLVPAICFVLIGSLAGYALHPRPAAPPQHGGAGDFRATALFATQAPTVIAGGKVPPSPAAAAPAGYVARSAHYTLTADVHAGF
jgi:hypothetical protein